MKSLHKRKILAFALLFLFIVVSISCNSTKPPNGEDKELNLLNFHVVFIDVGDGDATFIHFPDGKNVLIDCGSNEVLVRQNIDKVLDDYSVESLDLLILSSTLEESIGNANHVIENYNPKKVYIPYLLSPQNFPEFNKVLETLNSKNIQTLYSKTLERFYNQDYLLLFLSPKSHLIEDSPYNDLNFSLAPTPKQIRNVSPTFYLEYKNVRFLLGGLSDYKIEKEIVNYHRICYYKQFVKEDFSVNLENVDLYKLQNHGDENSNSQELLNLLKPKNAVVSVGGNNSQGHPHTSTLTRLFEESPSCNLYRTDTVGTVRVEINQLGEYTVTKQA